MLQNLHELGAQLQEAYVKNYPVKDKALPAVFKQLVKDIDGATVEYNEYSFIVTITSSAQKIFFPNQLLYVAACFADYYKALAEYARIIKTDLRISDSDIKQAKDNKEYAQELLADAILEDGDRELLVQFLSDYNWWYGGKGIERADYYISPILSLSKLVNASQSYVADLCRYLARNEKALKALQNEILLNKASSSDIIYVQSNDKNAFVWECIKHFNKNKELRPLFTSKYKGIGGSMGNYILINGCYVAQRDSDSNYDNIYVEGEGYIHNSFDARDIEKFAFAINDIYADSYKIVIDGNGQNKIYKLIKLQAQNIDIVSEYTPYLTALRTKPFMLLAGISGTGKSRIAREIAKACWPVGSEQREKQVPDNFCMVQVKPNWHDSTELLGYVSRIGGENKEKYISGDLLPFITKAWENPSVPYILCLDEMNLAPVEQYFAEYLSVIESRRMDNSGHITTDPILKKNGGDWYRLFTNELTDDDNLRVKFLEEGISIPQNLFVVGTVNMDETTFSFSRKVLDRAMTIEMNKVDLWSSLSEKPEGDLGYIGNILLSNAAKGTDVYIAHQALCDEAVKYLEKVNNILEGTPFKIAYRTRNEFMLYAVSREVIEKDSPLWKSLDEMTSMKILSRIEGDDERCKAVLNGLFNLLNDEFADNVEESVSIKKVNEMLDKLKKTGYTSYWT